MSQEFGYDFEWDPAKALSNFKKHGVSFEEAAAVALDALALTVYDAPGAMARSAGSRSASAPAAAS